MNEVQFDKPFKTSIIINFRQAVQNFEQKQSVIMDRLKIYDTQFCNRNKTSVLTFLDQKLKHHSDDPSKFVSVEGKNFSSKPSHILPHFSFAIQSYSIDEYVEYQVIFFEKLKVLGRTITKRYSFRTRYSMLEVLDRKLGGLGLPGKKFFGNKERSFIQKRKVDLEAYLNKVACLDKPEFYRFIKQIKDCQFNLSLKQDFTIQ